MYFNNDMIISHLVDYNINIISEKKIKKEIFQPIDKLKTN